MKVKVHVILLVLGLSVVAQADVLDQKISMQDSDADGVADSIDNCSEVANSDQRDTDGDGFGNICDPDLNNDGIVNFTDLTLWVPFFNTATSGDADFNGDGFANFADFSLIPNFFLQPPGPGAQLTAEFNLRPHRIEYDNDNNGVPDGYIEYQYDEIGRVIVRSNVETPDGTLDLIPYTPSEPNVTTLAYDDAGNIKSASVDYFDPNLTIDRNDSYIYDDNGLLLRVISSIGIDATFVYADGRPILADFGGAGSIIYTYDENGFFDTSAQVSDFGNFIFYDFDWNADGQVIRRRAGPDIPDLNEIVDFVRANGRTVKRIISNSTQSLPSQDYVELFVYDETSGRLDEVHLDDNDDGTIEAKLSIVWESGPCQFLQGPVALFALFIPVDTGGLDGDLTTPNGDFNFCAFE